MASEAPDAKIPWVWVVTARACQECGGHGAVLVLDHEPSEAQVESVKDIAGGGYCVVAVTTRAAIGTIISEGMGGICGSD